MWEMKKHFPLSFLWINRLIVEIANKLTVAIKTESVQVDLEERWTIQLEKLVMSMFSMIRNRINNENSNDE